LLPRVSFVKEAVCSCGNKVRLSKEDGEVIAAKAGLAQATNKDTIREVRHRFRAWRAALKQRGESDSDDAGAALVCNYVYSRPSTFRGGTCTYHT